MKRQIQLKGTKNRSVQLLPVNEMPESVDDMSGPVDEIPGPVDVIKHSDTLAEAIILQEIRFKIADSDVIVPVGTIVVVNGTEGLAFFQGNAFKIQADQYSLDYDSGNIVPSKAVLTQELCLNLGDTEVKIPAFTQILVDLENSIALLAGVHFDISAHEYSLLQ